jgi:hypothetical protein
MFYFGNGSMSNVYKFTLKQAPIERHQIMNEVILFIVIVPYTKSLIAVKYFSKYFIIIIPM